MSDVPDMWIKVGKYPAVKVDRLDVVRFGNDCIINCIVAGKPVIKLGGAPRRVVPEWEAAIEAIRGKTVAEWTTPAADDTPATPDDTLTGASVNAEQWRRIFEAFSRMPGTASDSTLMSAVADAYAAAVKQEKAIQRTQAGPLDQLSQDIAKLRPIVGTLKHKNGEWNQSAIAGTLGLPGTGGSYRPRILKVIDELERRAA